MWTTSTACNTIAHLPVAMLSEIGANLVWENTWKDFSASSLHLVTRIDERLQKYTEVSLSLMLSLKDVVTSSVPETVTRLVMWIFTALHSTCGTPRQLQLIQRVTLRLTSRHPASFEKYVTHRLDHLAR